MSVAVPVIDRIDGPTRRIFLRQGVTSWNPVDDIYKEVRQLRQDDESLRQFDAFCAAIPLNDKGGGAFTERGLILLEDEDGNPTFIVPFDESAIHIITGLLTSNFGTAGSALIDDSSLSATSKYKVEYAPPSTSETVVVEKFILTDEEKAMLLEIWQRLGLDPDNPMSSTEAQITFGNVTLNLTGDGVTTSTVTRAP